MLISSLSSGRNQIGELRYLRQDDTASGVSKPVPIPFHLLLQLCPPCQAGVFGLLETLMVQWTLRSSFKKPRVPLCKQVSATTWALVSSLTKWGENSVCLLMRVV